MTDPVSIVAGLKAAGALLAGKKMGVGALAAVTIMSDEVKSAWPLVAVLLVPLAGGAFFMGQISEQLGNNREWFAKEGASLNRSFAKELTNINDGLAGELALRDLKIDFAYDRANLGGRFTSGDGDALDDKYDARCDELGGRVLDLEHSCETTRDRVGKIEQNIRDRHPFSAHPTNGNP